MVLRNTKLTAWLMVFLLWPSPMALTTEFAAAC